MKRPLGRLVARDVPTQASTPRVMPLAAVSPSNQEDTVQPYLADADLVARAEYEHDMREAVCPDTWDETFPFVRDGYRSRARAGLDALAAAGRLPAAHHQPLLALTDDEVAALRFLARDLRANSGWIAPTLRSALGKLSPPAPLPAEGESES